MKSILKTIVLLVLLLSSINLQGKIIILNGTSTAGKSSIIEKFDSSYEHIALDIFVPQEWARILEKKTGKKHEVLININESEEESDKLDQQIKEAGFSEKQAEKIWDSMHERMFQKIRNLALQNKNVVVDTIVDEDKVIRQCLEAFHGLQNVFWVLVYCPFSNLVERARVRKKREGRAMLFAQPLAHFYHLYKAKENDNEVNLGPLYRKELDAAWQEARSYGDYGDFGISDEQFDKSAAHARQKLDLDNKDVVVVTPRLAYDCIVNSIKPPEQNATQIEACIAKIQGETAQEKNYRKYHESWGLKKTINWFKKRFVAQNKTFNWKTRKQVFLLRA
jgi:chloramphenicol 3-O-phosphotransferase